MDNNDLEFNFFTEKIFKEHKKQIDNHLKEIIKKHYPNVDVENTNELSKLIENEGLYIEYNNQRVDSSYKIVVSTEVKLMKKTELK